MARVIYLDENGKVREELVHLKDLYNFIRALGTSYIRYELV